nr:MAG TPA: hypothetical protein [Caudoviricetes sp.]
MLIKTDVTIKQRRRSVNALFRGLVLDRNYIAVAVSFNQDLGQWHLDSLKKAKEMEQFLSGADSFDYTVNRLPVLKCRKASES